MEVFEADAEAGAEAMTDANRDGIGTLQITILLAADQVGTIIEAVAAFVPARGRLTMTDITDPAAGAIMTMIEFGTPAHVESAMEHAKEPRAPKERKRSLLHHSPLRTSVIGVLCSYNSLPLD